MRSGPYASSRATVREAGPETSIRSTRWPSRSTAPASASTVSRVSNSASSSESESLRLCVSAMRMGEEARGHAAARDARHSRVAVGDEPGGAGAATGRIPWAISPALESTFASTTCVSAKMSPIRIPRRSVKIM